MSWERRVNRVVDHVRSNLQDDLSVGVLSGVAHASPFHFSRMFKTTTGETLVQFVQRARLERAATLMLARPDRSLGDIAHAVGFQSASDFSRVFKRRYGLAPSRWDRRTRLSATLPDYAAGLAQARATCPPLHPRVVHHPACQIAYVRVATPFLDAHLLQAGYDHLTDWLEARHIDWRKQTLLGLSWDNFETTPIERVRFDLGFTVPDHIQAEGNVGIQRFDAIRSVDVHVRGELGHIALAWEHLYDVWLPRSSSEPAHLPGIKRFRQRPDTLGWRTFDLDCSIALQPAR